MNELWEHDSRPAVEEARQAWTDATWEASKLPVWDAPAGDATADAAFATYVELFLNEPTSAAAAGAPPQQEAEAG